MSVKFLFGGLGMAIGGTIGGPVGAAIGGVFGKAIGGALDEEATSQYDSEHGTDQSYESDPPTSSDWWSDLSDWKNWHDIF